VLRQRFIKPRDEVTALTVETARTGLVRLRSYGDRALEIVKPSEIVLAAPDGAGGYTLVCRFRLAEGTSVTPVFQGLQPPTISIGEQGRDTQPFASSIIYDDLEGGLGVLHQSQRTGNNRFWWSTLDTRRREQTTLLRRKRDTGKPPGVVAEIPAAGGVYANRVWVAWGQRVRQWTEANGGTVAIASSTNPGPTAPIAVTTAVTHGYVTGWTVTIAGHLVNTAANGTWTITVTSPTTFTLNGSTGNGVGVATGSVVSVNGGWTNGSASTDRVLTGSSVPLTNPVEWEGGWFWPLGTNGIDYFNGTAWFTIAKPCVGLTAYAGSLWGVDSVGQVFSTNIGASAAVVKIVGGSLLAADFADRVRVSSQAQSMMTFMTADAAADVVPYVVGYNTLYQVDPATYIAQPAGPPMPPHRYPIRTTVLGSDNAVYIGQGLGVTQWSGDLATPVGLDLDDGVPSEQRGGIIRLANGGLTLFALVDGTRAETMAAMTMQGSDPSMAGVLGTTSGVSTLYGREPTGWHIRATSDTLQDSGASMLFVAAAEGTYRTWFSWGGLCYAINLEQGFLNPIDDPITEYEPTGQIFYSITDMSFKEAAKIGLMAELRVSGVGGDLGVRPWIQYDVDGAWHVLQNPDGSHGITTPGRHQYLLTQQPGRLLPAIKESPAAGYKTDYMQLRLDLWRGTSVPTRTPVVVFAGLHAIKTMRQVTGYRMTLDLTRFYNGMTAWSQRVRLLQLLHTGQGQLLHFAHLSDSDGPAGSPEVRAVRLMSFSGLTMGGMMHDYSGRIQLMVSEVLVPDA
jgi:hypothetical protein